ncbi:hypothetical protein E1287_33935 [Actinomadura sp. KC06]|uniref:5-methylcytosine restriction system specificity protein McrC n=1 Tax=Actinomadura sp. KC06 TaxID=2530369 RepID=UPI0010460360|nr:hypothetical protein [Actinomadura sp. KC06]TDD27783.1 hypothetical protein E1287_33935 [Actinomadura sp. KC06]
MVDEYPELQLRLPKGGPLAYGRLMDEQGTNGSQKFMVLAGSPAREDSVPSFPCGSRPPYADDGTRRAVADAKYKAEKPEGFPDADLCQMPAYCTALQLSDGHLVYAKGNAPHIAHRVRHTGITIHQHTLDLDQPPASLLAEVGTLARALEPRVSSAP